MTEHGTIEIRLKALNRTESNTTLDIVICDSGFDMEEAEKNKIFGAFDIHNHAPKSFGAAGLEFSITKKMIEMMNGTIAFRKHEPHGAVFRLLFKKVGVPDDAAIPKQNVKEIKDVTFSPATIIVADDVMTNRKLLAKYISRFSELTVAEAEDGEALLQLAEQLNPALIFTDIHMPGLSGYDAMKSLKQNKQLSSIIIIAVTASSFEEIHEDIEKYCDAYLRKPINGQELLKILIKYLPHDDPQTESQPPLPATTPGFAADNFENYGKNLPELADILDKDFKERVSSTADLLIINEIESLGLDLEKIGRQYDSPPVIDWAEKLIAEANMFDIQNLPETLAKFDDILNVIRRKAENTGE